MKLSRKVHEAQVRIRVTHEPTLESGPSLEESTDIYCSTKIVFTGRTETDDRGGQVPGEYSLQGSA